MKSLNSILSIRKIYFKIWFSFFKIYLPYKLTIHIKYILFLESITRKKIKILKTCFMYKIILSVLEMAVRP